MSLRPGPEAASGVSRHRRVAFRVSRSGVSMTFRVSSRTREIAQVRPEELAERRTGSVAQDHFSRTAARIERLDALVTDLDAARAKLVSAHPDLLRPVPDARAETATPAGPAHAPARPPRRSVRRRVTVALGAVSVVTLAVLVGASRDDPPDGTPSRGVGLPLPPRPSVGQPAVTPDAQPAPSRTGARQAVAGNRSPRVVTWAPVPGASFYWFQLYKIGLPGARKILEARPARPLYALRQSRRLTPGRYRWYAWPQFEAHTQPRYGDVFRQGSLLID